MTQSARIQKIPGPDHPISTTQDSRRVRVTFRGETVADSVEVVTLQEAGYPPVHYFPRKDVRMDLLRRTDHGSWCPYKGQASYFSIIVAGATADNAVWSYETPFDPVADIHERLAFYPSRVDSIEVL